MPQNMQSPGGSFESRADELGRAAPAGARPDRVSLFVSLFLAIATVAFLLARIPVLVRRSFDPDEFEHVHAAWCVFRGMIPYKDFFEHHTPWYYYALAPLFRWFHVDTSFDSARHFLLLGRGLSLVLTILSLGLVASLGRRWRAPHVGALAALLLVEQPFFFQKTVEIRPDVLALPFFLGGLCLLLHGLAANDAKHDLRSFFVAGSSLGAAILCTQKMLFVLPGTLAALGIWALLSGRERVLHRSLAGLVLVLGLCIPVTATWALFAWHHAGSEFIANNFLLNAGWKHVDADELPRLLTSSRPVLALAIVGASGSLYRFIRSEQRPYGDLLLLCIALALFAGLLVVPVAYRQYYLMPLPIVCLFAARGLVCLTDYARRSLRPWLLVLATIPLAILPVLDLQAALKQRNDRQWARLQYVLENTQPTDLVMDGWEGTGVFRPHAFYYFFIHGELVDRLPRERLDAYLTALEGRTIRPRLIAMDDNLVALGSRFVRFVKTNYVNRDVPGQAGASNEVRRFFKKIFKRNHTDVSFYLAKD